MLAPLLVSLFISMEVPAIARSNRGLCWEIKAPTRKPLAQKLKSGQLDNWYSSIRLTPCSFHERLFWVSSFLDPIRAEDSPCRRALSNLMPSSFSTSSAIMLVNGTALLKSVSPVSGYLGFPGWTHDGCHTRSLRKSHPRRDGDLSLRRTWHTRGGSLEGKSDQVGFEDYIGSDRPTQRPPSRSTSSAGRRATDHSPGDDPLPLTSAQSLLEGVQRRWREACIALWLRNSDRN